MRKFRIVTDSACDLPFEILQKIDVEAPALHLTIGGQEYKDYKDESEIKSKDFYARMRNGETAATSAVSVGEFEEVFEKYLKDGEDVLYIGFSSALSTTYQSAAIAAKDIGEKYPERKIYTVDALCASTGQGMLVYLCAKMADEGRSIEEVRDYAEETKLHICHAFTVDDLVYLKRGGRVSAATALVGGLLNIKPLLHVDNEGHLISIGKARGRKASIAWLAGYIKGRELPESKKIAFICHGDCLEDAELLKKMAMEQYGFEEVIIASTGAVVGAHSGPGTLAFFFVGGER